MVEFQKMLNADVMAFPLFHRDALPCYATLHKDNPSVKAPTDNTTSGDRPRPVFLTFNQRCVLHVSKVTADTGLRPKGRVCIIQQSNCSVSKGRCWTAVLYNKLETNLRSTREQKYAGYSVASANNANNPKKENIHVT